MSPEFTAESVWPSALSLIKEQLSEQQFETWFRSIELGQSTDSLLELTVPNSFLSDWLRKKYSDVILNAYAVVHGGMRPALRITVRKSNSCVSVDPDMSKRSSEPEAIQAADRSAQPSDLRGRFDAVRALRDAASIPQPSQPRKRGGASLLEGSTLHSEWRLQNFVTGSSSRVAHAASASLIESNTALYNPLFIHGAVGLGKSHLLQSIALGIQERRPSAKVLYLTCEHYINQYIAAVERGEIESFRQRCRELDVLLIDDIQFLADKEKSQEEFFHTFQQLHTKQRQIVISADVAPPGLSRLNDRLLSCFKWGLVCEVQVPDFDARLEIVRRKSERLGVPMPTDVAAHVAQLVRTNVRELEGAVTRVLGHATLLKIPVTLDLAVTVLRDVRCDRRRTVKLEHVARVVCSAFSAKLAEVQGKRRTQDVAGPRQVSMYLSRKLTPHSLDEIGGYFGGRDHSTVLYAIEKTESRANAEPAFRAHLEALSAQIADEAAS